MKRFSERFLRKSNITSFYHKDLGKGKREVRLKKFPSVKAEGGSARDLREEFRRALAPEKSAPIIAKTNTSK